MSSESFSANSKPEIPCFLCNIGALPHNPGQDLWNWVDYSGFREDLCPRKDMRAINNDCIDKVDGILQSRSCWKFITALGQPCHHNQGRPVLVVVPERFARVSQCGGDELMESPKPLHNILFFELILDSFTVTIYIIYSMYIYLFGDTDCHDINTEILYRKQINILIRLVICNPKNLQQKAWRC